MAVGRKLCVILNLAPHYRKAIYRAIDNAFDCDWYVGDRIEDIKVLSPNELKNCIVVKNKKIYKNNYFQSGIIRLLFDKRYTQFLITGDIRNISVWCFLLLAKLFTSKKVYTWTHGFNGKGSKIAMVFKKIFAAMSSGIFLYGDFARNYMISQGVNPDKLFVIHNSLDYDMQIACREAISSKNIYREHFGNDNKNLIFIGRLTRIKRLDLLLDALKRLRERGMFYNLTFVGDGIERKNLEKLSATYGLHDTVWFFGESYQEQTNAELIYNADLCVSPGNVGLTAIHSLVYGTPVATHNNFIMQMPEFEAIKEGETGTFFNYMDAESIACVIEKWFANFGNKREFVRDKCIKEISSKWNPQYQIDVLKRNLNL